MNAPHKLIENIYESPKDNDLRRKLSAEFSVVNPALSEYIEKSLELSQVRQFDSRTLLPSTKCLRDELQNLEETTEVQQWLDFCQAGSLQEFEPGFERGFPSCIACSAKELNDHLALLIEQKPFSTIDKWLVWEADFKIEISELQKAFCLPWLSQIRSIDFESCLIGDQVLLELTSDWKSSSVEELSFSNITLMYSQKEAKQEGVIISSIGIEALFRGPTFPHLKRLDFYGHQLKSEGAAQLASFFKDKPLQFLVLAKNSISDQGLSNLAESSGIDALEVLDLQMNCLEFSGVEKFFQNRKLTELKSLYLDWNQLQDESLSAICNSDLPSIEILALGNNLITNRGIQTLLQSDLFRSIKVLDLRNILLDQDSVDMLAERSNSLESIWISINSPTVSSIRRLVESPGMQNAKKIQITNTHLQYGTHSDISPFYAGKVIWFGT